MVIFILRKKHVSMSHVNIIRLFVVHVDGFLTVLVDGILTEDNYVSKYKFESFSVKLFFQDTYVKGGYIWRFLTFFFFFRKINKHPPLIDCAKQSRYLL